MSLSLPELKEPIQIPAAEGRAGFSLNMPPASPPRVRLRTLLAIPMAASLALALHFIVSTGRPLSETRPYSWFLGLTVASSLVAAAAQSIWARLRRWMNHMCPIIAAVILFLCLWDLITSGFHWLPLPYF